ncbi:hypothetical protein CDAR_85491 [Caerostris darwini]|uniref:Uncharacterized protein n=1 Tax=Caerostris darwini TaxID=1538125 RepID=A0AAV4R0W6_9ARAC|nr:hypothetical protein CDAR_85491 [Caerostris darwini]
MKDNCCNGELGHVLCRDQEEIVSPENLNEKIRMRNVVSNRILAFWKKENTPSKVRNQITAKLAKMQIRYSEKHKKLGNEITLCVLISDTFYGKIVPTDIFWFFIPVN